jgi:hypothetical protein
MVSPIPTSGSALRALKEGASCAPLDFVPLQQDRPARARFPGLNSNFVLIDQTLG